MDTEIPDLNLFMMCNTLCPSACSPLPSGYSFRLCKRKELEKWKALHIDDPEQYDVYDAILSNYIERVYAPKGNEFYQKCVFVCDAKGRPVGTCFIWKAYNLFYAVHWLKVMPQYEGKGLGRAILSFVLESLPAKDYPVFLHTHPSSYRAIKLYSDFGFKFLTDEVTGYRKNDLVESMFILKERLPTRDYQNLKITSAPQFFLDAALSSAMEEF